MKKIEIDLQDILGDENGAETLQESIRRQVIEAITKEIAGGVKNHINEAVSATITDELGKYLKKQLPKLYAEMMDASYRPVSTWGAKGEETTLRKELLKSITENMVYKRTQYSSDRNAFTAAVDSVMGEQLAAFQKDFNKTVEGTFTAAAFEYARKKVQEKLGIS